MSSLRLAVLTCIAAAFVLSVRPVSFAQTPPPATPAPPADAQPAPAPAPGPAPAPTPAPEPPASTQPAPPPPAQARPGQPGDPFGQEIMLSPKTMVFMQGSGNWDTAYETIIDAFKSIQSFLDKQGIKPSGLPMTIYTQTDDLGFQFQAGIPIAEPPKDAPRGDLGVGKSPEGKALKFVHRGSYDSMDTTYEAITNYLDEKRLEAEDMFIEEYVTDPVKTPEDKLVVNVLVPLK